MGSSFRPQLERLGDIIAPSTLVGPMPEDPTGTPVPTEPAVVAPAVPAATEVVAVSDLLLDAASTVVLAVDAMAPTTFDPADVEPAVQPTADGPDDGCAPIDLDATGVVTAAGATVAVTTATTPPAPYVRVFDPSDLGLDIILGLEGEATALLATASTAVVTGVVLTPYLP